MARAHSLAAALAALLAASSSSPASAQLNQLVWGNSAFAPLAAATTSLVPNLNFTTAFAQPYSSVRFTGTISTAQDDLITFSAETDAGLRLWVDDHLVINDGTGTGQRTSTSFLNIPFTAGVGQFFRLEYNLWAGTPVSSTTPLQLWWSGNNTAKAVVPGSAFSPTVSSAQQQRFLVRDSLISPNVSAWQTYNNPSMLSHVLMPGGFIVDATLIDTSNNASLGNVIVFRQSNPAVVFIGGHSVNGSDFTSLSLGKWGPRECDVTFQTTVVNGGQDLLFLASSNGTDCAHMALLVKPFMATERAGNISMGSDGVSFVANLPGFGAVTTHAVGANPVPFPPANVTTYLALPFGANGGIVGFSTGPAPYAIEYMQAAIASASAAQAQFKEKYGEYSDVADGISSVILWNTMFTPIEGVITPVSRGWDFGSGYVL
jgi:hypothetical protein